MNGQLTRVSNSKLQPKVKTEFCLSAMISLGKYFTHPYLLIADNYLVCTADTCMLADHMYCMTLSLTRCSSYVGRTGGVQVVSVSGNCLSKGEVMHLIGHVIGLWNEHARPDRDEFIKVLYENIIETEQDNFGRLTTEKFNLVPDVGYDVESIMHFGPFTFSKNNKRTIRLRDDAPLSYKHCTNLLAMGQRNELSYLDKLRANKLYSCQGEFNLDCVECTPIRMGQRSAICAFKS